MSLNLKKTCVDEQERDYFNKLSTEWWNDPRLKLLRNVPGLFVPYICSNVKECFPNKPIESLRILEVGCGGGYFSEELSRAGFNLVAIDISEDLLEIAKAHAELDPTLPKIKYLLEPIEEHCKLNFKQYDVVISNFVLEHVSDHDYFIKCCSDCVKPGGLLFMSAIAKTFLSWLCIIYISENILGVVPKGMHHYDKCIRACDTERIIESYNFKVQSTKESLHILEVGCGGGYFSEELSRAGCNLVAIDISEDLLEIAKAHAELDPTLPKTKYLLEAIEEHCKLNFNQYDVVVSNFVLEHVSDHDYFIKCCFIYERNRKNIYELACYNYNF